MDHHYTALQQWWFLFDSFFWYYGGVLMLEIREYIATLVSQLLSIVYSIYENIIRRWCFLLVSSVGWSEKSFFCWLNTFLVYSYWAERGCKLLYWNELLMSTPLSLKGSSNSWGIVFTSFIVLSLLLLLMNWY